MARAALGLFGSTTRPGMRGKNSLNLGGLGLFGSQARPGMRGQSSVNLGNYIAVGDDPAAIVTKEQRFQEFAKYASLAADLAIAMGGAFALYRALKK